MKSTKEHIVESMMIRNKKKDLKVVNVNFTRKQMYFIDDICRRINNTGGKKLTKSTFINALLSAMSEVRINTGEIGNGGYYGKDTFKCK